MTGDEPQIGGKSANNNAPELSGARPKCKICNTPLAPVKNAILYVDGKYRFGNAVWSYACHHNEDQIMAVLSPEDTAMVGEGSHYISVSYITDVGDTQEIDE